MAHTTMKKQLMKTVKTCELEGAALDWVVALCEGVAMRKEEVALEVQAMLKGRLEDFHPSTDWSQAGPIIERELLEVSPHFQSSSQTNDWKGAWHWVVYVLGPNNLDESHEQHGPTPLIAAMRCYVALKLGQEVQVPEDLPNA